MIICSLCIKIGEACNSVLNEERNQNDIYQLIEKYFPMQIGNINKTECEVCTSCWSKMDDFYRFQEMVIISHSLFHSVEEIKCDIDGAPALNPEPDSEQLEHSDKTKDIDPFEVADVKFEHTSSEHSFVADEEKPLLSRIRPKRKCKSKAKSKAIGQVKIRQKRKRESLSNPHNQIQKPVNIKSRQTFQELDAFIAEHWKTSISCPLCKFNCTSYSLLSKHFVVNHEGRRCFVECCRKQFRSRPHLIDHIKFHMNPQQFQCPHCGINFSSGRSIRTHTKNAHAEKKLERIFECNVCQKSFAKKSILKGHMEIHAEGEKKYVCTYCDKGFVLENRLKIHINTVHSEPIICELCGTSIKGPYRMKEHLRKHEGKKRPTWPCSQCKAELNTKFSFQRHMRLHHHNGTTLFKCSDCGKAALTVEALRSHKNYAHNKERKYKCTICDKSFKRQLVLREHMTTHTGEDLYKCPHCPKTFRVSANMHHHRKRMHPKEWLETHRHRNLITNVVLDKVAKEVIL